MTPEALRRAAILLASVDEETAHALLEQLPPAQAAALRGHWALLDEVDPRQQQAVIDDFLVAGRAAPSIPDVGLELDDTLPERLELETPAEASAASWMQPQIREPFEFLLETDAAVIAQHLDGEHPQAIALVLAHLPLSRAAAVLEHLPAAAQEEALARMVEADETAPEIVREVERGLETRLSEQVRRRDLRRRGEHLASAMLAEMGSGRRLLARMARRDPSLAARLGYQRRAPRSLDELHDAALAEAFDAVGIDVAALALAGAESAEADRALARLPHLDADALRRRLAQLGPIRLDDLEAAYGRVLAAAAGE